MEINIPMLRMLLVQRKMKDVRTIIPSKSKIYLLNKKEVKNLGIKQIIPLANTLNRRIRNSHRNEYYAQKWMWGQYKLFLWIVIYYTEALFINTGSFVIINITKDQQTFQIIPELFPSKQKSFLQYEYYTSFCPQKSSRSDWNSEEDLLFKKVFEKKQALNQWKLISYEIFKESNGLYFKTSDDCRNRWANHFNPSLNKKAWTLQEDKKLMGLTIALGRKWAQIGKNICGRTEHMIKNRYWCLVKKLHIKQNCLSVKEVSEKIIGNLNENQYQSQTIQQISQVGQSIMCPQQREVIQKKEEEQKKQNNHNEQVKKDSAKEEDSNQIGTIFSNYLTMKSIQIASQQKQLGIDQIIRVLDQRQLGGDYNIFHSFGSIIYNYDDSEMKQSLHQIDFDNL